MTRLEIGPDNLSAHTLVKIVQFGQKSSSFIFEDQRCQVLYLHEDLLTG